MSTNIISRFDSVRTRYISGSTWNNAAEFIEPDLTSNERMYLQHNVSDPSRPQLIFDPSDYEPGPSSVIPQKLTQQVAIPDSIGLTNVHIIGNLYNVDLADNREQSFTIIVDRFTIQQDVQDFIMTIYIDMVEFENIFGFNLIGQGTGSMFIQESEQDTSIREVPIIGVFESLVDGRLSTINPENYRTGNIVHSIKIVV